MENMIQIGPMVFTLEKTEMGFLAIKHGNHYFGGRNKIRHVEHIEDAFQFTSKEKAEEWLKKEAIDA